MRKRELKRHLGAAVRAWAEAAVMSDPLTACWYWEAKAAAEAAPLGGQPPERGVAALSGRGAAGARRVTPAIAA